MGYEDRQASQSGWLQGSGARAGGDSSGCISDAFDDKKSWPLLRGSGKPYCTHMRNEGDTLLESLAEAIEIAKSGDGILQVSHFKTSQQRNWNKLDAALGMVEKARAEGMQIFADRYPYTYSSTSLRMVVPPPYNKIDSGSLTKLLQESAQEREKLAKLLETGNGERDNWDKIILVISSAPEHAKLYGKNMLQIAEQLGMSAAQACVKLLSEVPPSAAFGSMSRIVFSQWCQLAATHIASDGQRIRAWQLSQVFPAAGQQASIESETQRTPHFQP